MSDMKKLIKDTVVEMFEEGELIIETHITETMYPDELVNEIYHCSEGGRKRKINSFRVRI